MATHAATRNLSGLARALAQHGLMPESEAESLQNQAQAANIFSTVSFGMPPSAPP